MDRYCQQVLNETVRTAKLTPIAARLQEVEGKVDQHVIPKEVLYLLSCCPPGSSSADDRGIITSREALRGDTELKKQLFNALKMLLLCSVFQTLVIYALGVVLQDRDTWSAPYRSALYFLTCASSR